MQSFKEYLLENNPVGHLPTVSVHLEFMERPSRATFEVIKYQMTKYINENYKLPKFEIVDKSARDEMTISLHDVPQHLFDTVDFLNDLHEIAIDVLEELADAFTYIDINWPPAYKMVIQNHVTFLHVDGSQSLNGIEKLIEGDSAFQLDVRIELPAKEIGVLSLLKVKGFERVIISGTIEKQEEYHKVITILQKHFDSGRNILACQEELIDAGLKDYAEL